VSLNSGFRPCEWPNFKRISVELVDGLIQLGKCILYFFAAHQPLSSQYSHIISSLDFNHHFEV